MGLHFRIAHIAQRIDDEDIEFKIKDRGYYKIKIA